MVFFLFSDSKRLVVHSLIIMAAMSLGQHCRMALAQEVIESSTSDGSIVYQLRAGISGNWTDADALARSFRRDGCPGNGTLAKITNSEEAGLVANVSYDYYSWIGLSRQSGSSPWVWSKDGETWDRNDPDSYDGFQSGYPSSGGGNCVEFNRDTGKWRNFDCTDAFNYFIVQFDCGPAVAPAMDDDWNVAFLSGTAAFDDGDGPEVALAYNASAPNDARKYYVQQVLHPDCVTAVTAQEGGFIFPAVTGRIPDSDYADGVLTTGIYVNTSSIERSAVFWTNGTSPGRGTIEFCAKVDLYNENGNGIATESTKVTLRVDATVGFEVFANFTNEATTSEEEDVQVDYELDVAFCDDNGEAVTPAPPALYPGDVLQVCIGSASPDEAVVADVRSVAFANSLAGGLSFEVIDAQGVEGNEQTSKDCDASAGICKIKTVTFSSLYQFDANNDGVLEDVSSGATFSGTAVLNFARRRRLDDRRRLAGVTGFTFDIASSLELPLPITRDDASSSPSASDEGALDGTIGACALAAAAIAMAVAMWFWRNSGMAAFKKGYNVAATDEASPETTNMI